MAKFSKGQNVVPIDQSRAMRELRVFHDVARALTSTLDLDSILRTIMDQMAQYFGPETWSLMMLDEARNDLYYAITVGENAESLRHVRIPVGSGIAGWVAEHGVPLVVPSVVDDPRFAVFLRENPEINLQSVACVPIRSGDRLLGIIQLMNYKLDLLADDAISFLYMLSDYAAIAIQNARYVSRIHELSITDDCTGLFNARHLYRLLDAQVENCAGGAGCFSLLFMDMDHFKSVNDTHGHLVGSRLLAEVGEMLRSCLSEQDSAFRYGGDEFVMLFPGSDKQAAMRTAQTIYARLQDAVFLQGNELELKVRASFGLATFPEDGDSVHAIIRSADNMMYQVKNSTRDNIGVAQRGLLNPRRKVSSIAAALPV